jgi:predicted N-formylglutamate amidohydrolase
VAFLTRHLDGDKRFLILCDHASNYVPPEMDNLGLPPEELTRHIAFDPGAFEVAEIIAATLGAPLVAAQFSRLIIDPNRGLDDPTLVVKLSDGAVIPANRHVDPYRDKAAWQARIDAFYTPYNQAIEAAIDAALADDVVPVILSVHSFTPLWRGSLRPMHTAVLWDKDDRLKRVIDNYMADLPDIVYGDNEPYTGRLKNDCLYRHGTKKGLPHALIELRQDIIGEAQGQSVWAAHMVEVLRRAVERPGMAQIAHFGSVNDIGKP